MCGCNATIDGADILLEVSSHSYLLTVTFIVVKYFKIAVGLYEQQVLVTS